MKPYAVFSRNLFSSNINSPILLEGVESQGRSREHAEIRIRYKRY